MKQQILLVVIASSLVSTITEARSDESIAAHNDSVRKTTAVALNYCRAALHRIRRAPQKSVFHEEQTRILNNLDLNQIEDPEVISLYKSILDEISLVEISERERVVIDEQFRRSVHRQLGTNFFVISAQVATGQVGSAIQSGANSWWDYRNTEVRRDSDHWKVEKGEFTNLMSRSSTFLDSFWRLSQKNNIPDRWLIRDQDLDQLSHVLAENDATQRLRMLKRLERFMECYPPYWYYVARTQQQMGQSEDALRTYQRLTDIGSGHFRQDEMLATSMANMALLQEIQGDPNAPMTAMRVMDYSIRNWEANLVCAWVLGRHNKFDSAEELILCNLDEDQEPSQSRVALVSLYYHSDNTTKLAALLDDPTVVRDVPIPGLLLCAKSLGAGRMPQKAQAYLASTLSATVRRAGRGNTVTLSASNGWKIQDASPEVVAGSEEYRAVGYRPANEGVWAEFSGDTGGEGQALASVDSERLRVTLNYPGTPAIVITMNIAASVPQNRMLPGRGHFSAPAFQPRLATPVFGVTDVRYEIGSIELEGVRLSFQEEPPSDARVDDSKQEVLLEDATIRS